LITQQQLATLNDKGEYHTYIGVEFLSKNHSFIPLSANFNSFLTHCSPFKCALAQISLPGVLLDSTSLPPKLLSFIKQHLKSRVDQFNQDTSTSNQATMNAFGDIETDIPLQDVMDVDISENHNETEAVAMVMEDALFDVKSWFLVLEDVDEWNESEATVANLYLDAISNSVGLGNTNV
jgi:hypothetical protein